MDRKLEALAQLLGKLLNFSCLRAGAAAQTQGMPHDDLAHVILTNDRFEVFEINAFAGAL